MARRRLNQLCVKTWTPVFRPSRLGELTPGAKGLQRRSSLTELRHVHFGGIKRAQRVARYRCFANDPLGCIMLLHSYALISGDMWQITRCWSQM